MIPWFVALRSASIMVASLVTAQSDGVADVLHLPLVAVESDP